MAYSTFQECGTVSSHENVSQYHKHLSREISTDSMEKYNLNENLSDLQTLSENWSSYPVSNYNCSRPGAFFPWPRNITGKRVEKHDNRSISPNALLGIEIERRPPTNIPGPIKMAFGRAAPGYYAQKYPSKETWFNSTALHRHIPIIRFNPFSRDLDNYKNDDDEYKKIFIQSK
ncbi:hypothetical protein Smp_140370 [Schistosoma mansoni]|uniref:hypothetical protein n=1 Tax=Schistosoma mansoni TaxID=6183 RepID=UPI0001A63A5C|nr:hypothetical protein Smp_140370 [Schistosoma mansoni]|eukprot:XP_018645222.1 hypothetical protein Smp_140370 [Schistosoma mansoni]